MQVKTLLRLVQFNSVPFDSRDVVNEALQRGLLGIRAHCHVRQLPVGKTCSLHGRRCKLDVSDVCRCISDAVCRQNVKTLQHRRLCQATLYAAVDTNSYNDTAHNRNNSTGRSYIDRIRGRVNAPKPCLRWCDRTRLN